MASFLFRLRCLGRWPRAVPEPPGRGGPSRRPGPAGPHGPVRAVDRLRPESPRSRRRSRAVARQPRDSARPTDSRPKCRRRPRVRDARHPGVQSGGHDLPRGNRCVQQSFDRSPGRRIDQRRNDSNGETAIFFLVCQPLLSIDNVKQTSCQLGGARGAPGERRLPGGGRRAGSTILSLPVERKLHSCGYRAGNPRVKPCVERGARGTGRPAARERSGMTTAHQGTTERS